MENCHYWRLAGTWTHSLVTLESHSYLTQGPGGRRTDYEDVLLAISPCVKIYYVYRFLIQSESFTLKQ